MNTGKFLRALCTPKQRVLMARVEHKDDNGIHYIQVQHPTWLHWAFNYANKKLGHIPVGKPERHGLMTKQWLVTGSKNWIRRS